MASEAGFDVKLLEDRVRDLAEHVRPRRLRGVSDRLVRPHRSRRQFVELRAHGGPLNAAHYSNKDVDTWLDQARLTTDINQRRDLYRQVSSRRERTCR